MNKTISDMKMQAMPDEKTINGLMERLPKKAPKSRTRFTGTVIAAAAAVAVLGVSAAAIVNYYHQQSVEAFMGTGSSSTGSEPVVTDDSGLVSENEHFRFTVDKTFFDGDNLAMIITAESLDGTPWDRIPTIQMCKDERFNSADLFPVRYSFSTWNSQAAQELPENIHPFIALLDSDYLHTLPFKGDVDLTGDSYIRFFSGQVFTYINREQDTDENNIFHDITLRVNVEKNVQTKELFNSDGGRLTLSEIGFYSDRSSGVPEMFSDLNRGQTYFVSPEIKFINEDGTLTPFDEHYYSEWNGDYCYSLFLSTIDLGGIAGIEIGGVRFLG